MFYNDLNNNKERGVTKYISTLKGIMDDTENRHNGSLLRIAVELSIEGRHKTELRYKIKIEPGEIEIVMGALVEIIEKIKDR